MYKDVFGMWVKPDNIKVFPSLEGVSFCGMVWTKRKGQYVGKPNVDKILSTLSDPVTRLPDIQSLWGKLISLRLLCENESEEVVDYLDKQIESVSCHAKEAGIALPKIGPDFYAEIW